MKYATLQQILEAEREANGAEWPKVGATLALMWLKRCVLFSCVDVCGGAARDFGRHEKISHH